MNKPKTCPVCKEKFVRIRAIQPVCTKIKCQVEYSQRLLQKKKDAAQKVARKTYRLAKEKLKTRSSYIKEAQSAFNAFIRYRDKDKPCICCGLPLTSQSIGGLYDCGHYRSVGSAPHLRFDERNAHGQRKQCNRWGAGRAVDYRLGLIQRIGLNEVESLESNQETAHWTIDELKVIKKTYLTMTKELKKAKGFI